jgi:hypothetical protein
MRSLKHGVAVFALMAALASYVTKYQSSAYTGGFEETPLSPNVFQVRFRGNGYTPPRRIWPLGTASGEDSRAYSATPHIEIVPTPHHIPSGYLC